MQRHPSVCVGHREGAWLSGIYSLVLHTADHRDSRCEAELYAQLEAARCIRHFQLAAQLLELKQQGPTIKEALSSTGGGAC